jgi:hypothetical protein
MYASAQPLDFLAMTEIFRLKAVSGMTKLSLLSESETASVPSGVSGWTLVCFINSPKTESFVKNRR